MLTAIKKTNHIWAAPMQSGLNKIIINQKVKSRARAGKNNFINHYTVVAVVTMVFISSCVPSRQFDELQAKEKQCRDEADSLRTENRTLRSANDELTVKAERLSKDNKSLVTDTTQMGTAMSRLNGLYGELNKSYDRLIANQDKMLAGSNAETKKLIGQLQATQDDLQKKEDMLRKTEQELNEKEKYLNELNVTLRDRENKIGDLQGAMNRKDSAVSALRNVVSNALLGFKENGLTVSVKNGKVYVSLEERLLFQSGSTVVDKKGEDALKQLAKVLEKNPDINVLIEGHTDNVPIASGPIKDNWDLSVMRATSVVRIMRTNPKVDAARLTAAGRSEFLPIDNANTPEARKKNRRTEIILTPKLDELFKALESN